MRTFDYSFLESGMLPAHFVNTISEIAVLAERVNNRRGGLGEVLDMLEPIDTERSVEAYAKISGVSDDDKLTGYREALTLIHDDSPHHAFRENIQEDDFLRLYKILLPTSRGYKSSPVIIEVKLKGRLFCHSRKLRGLA